MCNGLVMGTDTAREDIIAVAMRYLEALISHDADSVPFAPDAWRITNGGPAVAGEEQLRAIIPREPVAEITDLAWVVDGEQAVVFYDLAADFSMVTTGELGPVEDRVPCSIAERFRVRGGLIHEIEVVYAAASDRAGRPRIGRAPATATGTTATGRAGGGGDSGPKGPCPADTTACVQWTALQYLGALLSHDGSAVPLAADAWRIENGHDSGRGDGIRDALALPIMHVISRLDAMRWFFEGDQAVVLYSLAAAGGGGVAATPAVPIAERFRVRDGLIHEIEAVFPPPAPADAGALTSVRS
jgi:hypothetical protein